MLGGGSQKVLCYERQRSKGFNFQNVFVFIIRGKVRVKENRIVWNTWFIMNRYNES